MGSVWRRLGSKVTVVEFLDAIVPNMDTEVGTALHKTLAKQGMEFRLGTKVTGAKTTKTQVTLMVEPAAGGDAEDINAMWCWCRLAASRLPKVSASNTSGWRWTSVA